MEFRWNDWNLEHVRKHGLTPWEAEQMIRMARAPYPEKRPDEKWLVRGRGSGGRFVQVVCVLDPVGTIYVIHARPLTPAERRRLRRTSS